MVMVVYEMALYDVIAIWFMRYDMISDWTMAVLLLDL